MLGAAHAFETFALLLPCPLCLRQREVYWAVVAMTVTALALWQVRQNPRFILAFNIMLGLVFLTGAVVAAYHAGVEYRFWPAPSGCTANLVDMDAIDLSSALQTSSSVYGIAKELKASPFSPEDTSRHRATVKSYTHTEI